MLKKYIVFIIFIIIVTLVSGCVKKPINTNQAPKNQTQNIDRQKNIDADIDTSNWQTYRNEGYGFELRYPVDWYVKERNFENIDETLISFSNNSNGQNNDNIAISTATNLITFFVRAYPISDKYLHLEKNYKKASNEIFYHDLDGKKIIQYFITNRTKEKDNISWDVVLPESHAFLNDTGSKYNYIFHFGFSGAYDEDGTTISDRKKISFDFFNQILKTFLLIEK